MSEVRAGYDVTECLWIEESEFGKVPTTGAWNPIWLVNSFDPRPRPVHKRKIGVGRQLPSKFVLMKEYAEAVIEGELVAKVTDPAFEWSNIWYYIITNAAYGATFSLGKRLKSLSIGAKLDLVADRFWLLNGCKLDGFELSSEVAESVKQRISVLGQLARFSGTDYVIDPVTRIANPATDFIAHEDSDIVIGVSVIDRLNNWSFNVRRTLEKHGKDAITKTLYRAFLEREVDISLKINLDFDSDTELAQFVESTEFTAILKIPDIVGGRQITLTGGKWLEHGGPYRELDLISVDLTAEFAGLSVATITE